MSTMNKETIQDTKELTKNEKQILLHTLGMNDLRWFETDKIKKPYRNRFYTSENTTDYKHIESLISMGLMEDTKSGWDGQDARYFIATGKGIEIAKQIAFASISKVSRSKKRYELYLHCDIDESFGEWIKDKYWDNYRKRHGV